MINNGARGNNPNIVRDSYKQIMGNSPAVVHPHKPGYTPVG